MGQRVRIPLRQALSKRRQTVSLQLADADEPGMVSIFIMLTQGPRRLPMPGCFFRTLDELAADQIQQQRLI
jgi:hypothetical protein